jgi:hypothetical protein
MWVIPDVEKEESMSYTHITEIMPPDMPDWAWDAIHEGLLARRSIERVERLEAQLEAVKRERDKWYKSATRRIKRIAKTADIPRWTNTMSIKVMTVVTWGEWVKWDDVVECLKLPEAPEQEQGDD